MNWIEGISEAINYIEANLENDLKIEEIAQKAFASSFCFQKSFSMLCGFTVGEYIRNRRRGDFCPKYDIMRLEK